MESIVKESHKRSRHPKYKPKYRVKNWNQYEESLRNMGNVTLWLSPKAIKSRKSKKSGKQGRQQKYPTFSFFKGDFRRFFAHFLRFEIRPSNRKHSYIKIVILSSSQTNKRICDVIIWDDESITSNSRPHYIVKKKQVPKTDIKTKS